MPRQRKKYGINIKNPLSLPVSVRIKSKTGALHTGDGYETWRTIRPNGTIYIPLKGNGQVEVDVQIIRYDDTGQTHNLGEGGWEHVDHKDLTPQTMVTKPRPGKKEVPEHITEEKPKQEPVEEEEPIRSLSDMIQDLKKEEVPV